MKNVKGIWLPDSEIHLDKMLGQQIDGKATYQYQKLEAALKHVRKRRCALDIGMHVGLWAMHLAKVFKTVIGFEPVPEHIECLRLNMAGIKNYTIHNCALGNQRRDVGLQFFAGSSGSTQIIEDGHGTSMLRLDDFELYDVDFIKIDVEHYEIFVIEGAEQTIRKHKPVIILEQKRKTDNKLNYGNKEQYAAKKLLESWGARQKFEMHGDCCMGWT